jgi:hypothetical protein
LPSPRWCRSRWRRSPNALRSSGAKPATPQSLDRDAHRDGSKAVAARFRIPGVR